MIYATRTVRAACLAVLTMLLAVSGCASSPEQDEPTGTSPTSNRPTVDAQGTGSGTTGTGTSAAPSTRVRTLEITVSGGDVTPPPSQVDLAAGETLRLVVTSDRDSELHAHGFEIDAPVPAGEPTSIDVVGTVPGVYEVELHDPDLLLLQVAVR